MCVYVCVCVCVCVEKRRKLTHLLRNLRVGFYQRLKDCMETLHGHLREKKEGEKKGGKKGKQGEKMENSVYTSHSPLD